MKISVHTISFLFLKCIVSVQSERFSFRIFIQIKNATKTSDFVPNILCSSDAALHCSIESHPGDDCAPLGVRVPHPHQAGVFIPLSLQTELKMVLYISCTILWHLSVIGG